MTKEYWLLTSTTEAFKLAINQWSGVGVWVPRSKVSVERPDPLSRRVIVTWL
jgi:hypothetical protein